MLSTGEERGNTKGAPTHPASIRGAVRVTAPARLHLGFLDLEGGLGRRFGSLGLALDRPATRLVLARAPALRLSGPDARWAAPILAFLAEHFDLEGPLALTIEAAIPAHAGLGSGTQLALALGAAAASLADEPADPTELVSLLNRGERSAIGAGAFAQGGVILDGGRGNHARPPPVLARLPFPEEWRVLLILDPSRRGLWGHAERQAFEQLPPFPERTTERLCRLVLMAALPALAEEDCTAFGAAVAELQRVVGDYFAPAQGGRFLSPAVAASLAELERAGIAGVGQSSWGPTGFALLPSAETGEEALARLSRRAEEAKLTLSLCRGRNRGADIAVAD